MHGSPDERYDESLAGANVDALICCGDLCSPFVVGLLASGFPGPIHAVAGNNEGDWRRLMLSAARANQERSEAAQITFHGQFFESELPQVEATPALKPGTLMGYNPMKEGDIKDVVATYALYDTGVAQEQAVQFYQVREPWRGPQQVGTVVPFDVVRGEK